MTEMELTTRLKEFVHNISQKAQTSPTMRQMLGPLLLELQILDPGIDFYGSKPYADRARHT